MSSSTLLIVFVDMPSVKKGMILPFSCFDSVCGHALGENLFIFTLLIVRVDIAGSRIDLSYRMKIIARNAGIGGRVVTEKAFNCSSTFELIQTTAVEGAECNIITDYKFNSILKLCYRMLRSNSCFMVMEPLDYTSIIYFQFPEKECDAFSKTSGNATKLALGKPQAIILEDRKKMSNPTGEEKRARQKEKESERSWRDRGQSLEVIIHVSVSTKREDSTDIICRNQQLLDSIANCRDKTMTLYQERVAGMYSALPYALAQVRRKDFNYKNVIRIQTPKLVSFSI
ncbi:hypothetical protein EZV62_028189 [Acer yangbiense]|uniref:Uncharacterized protein n=1 Tax=Acer yangbiense TaxID=1000413 RepID=A0A5C7GPA1_9ROSI|nr:hypothetical protein EZV62_028189 [Acer yangbiense]